MPRLEIPLLASLIYAKCTRSERLVLWDCLRSLAINIHTPWIVGGDFNAIIHSGERLNGAVPHAGSMEDFATALLDRAFWAKQRRLKQALKRWNKEVFRDIFHNLKVAEQRAADCEIIFQQEQSTENRATMNKAYAQLNHLLSVEELFWQQKSSIKWLVEGKRNTKFFHMRVKKKRIKSHIFKIQNLDGSWIKEPDAVKSSVVDFFSSLMKKEPCDMSRFDTSLIPAIIFENENLSLCAVPSMEELEEAVFNIDKDNVVGPDGFFSYFYQQCWDIVANDFLDAVVDFFHGIDLPRGITSTTIMLLPKNNNAPKWSDFKPISLCNVLNKIITKILANRLANVLPSMITDNQSGFVGGKTDQRQYTFCPKTNWED
ncbi:Uncharacterized protein TCM_008802 [Theobroma cacao]|uniref:Reverse transcriptase domain-containing protein n=1 Tax=Theobroma cacao TaxID=3641 RepID=A0A061E5C7_THECC|nr:Uncharacterized protein TCM_008802 [Theobroma cacao]